MLGPVAGEAEGDEVRLVVAAAVPHAVTVIHVERVRHRACRSAALAAVPIALLDAATQRGRRPIPRVGYALRVPLRFHRSPGPPRIVL